MKKPGSATDPLWYKDAIIYELHVRTFFDSDNDGIGDFRGLVQKLDYLSELGVTCVWLLPFFPSPLRDDGYDISDYLTVNPAYGTMEDFKEFLDAAHARGMQVLIELVVNHTSDQHPWFQAARRAPPGSPERDFYVWSDTDEKYPDVRIIFTDTEKSNWTWDPEAKQYYWHRFFSHQPDLNFDNPQVVEEIVRIMRFWLDLGVDALRLDAIPYLVERDGTNGENLPETHAIIKRLRRELDAQHANRMILAEANQWPSDVRAYFGDGDECHMAFHFPLMPRLFMALRTEDRHPVVDVMLQTPPIPDSCQWALFLRNHDELTLEMVTNDERDYMWLAYSADPRMRVNVGIRRRLAPLLENNRRRIELLNTILLSFPGTPIIYYGDEIGMGDNIYLGDRHGVRTPMQWSPDRNAGFSRANPARLLNPVIMDPVFGYEVVNVESQQSDPSSLLNWTRHMLALRKLFKVFGRGTMEFLHPTNRKILAYVRRYEGEIVLCVANLSRFAQPFELDLSGFAGMVPVEMAGYVEFPRITRNPYPLTLGPYGYLWFELHGAVTVEMPVAEESPDAVAAVAAGAGWDVLFDRPGRRALEQQYLPDFLARRRWFGWRPGQVRACTLNDWIPLSESLGIALVDVEGSAGRATFILPLAIARNATAERLLHEQPQAVVCAASGASGRAAVHDAVVSDEACRALFAAALARQVPRGSNGVLSVVTTAAERPAVTADVAVSRQETDTYAFIRFGDLFYLKLFRQLQFGTNPEIEVTRYLAERRGFGGVLPVAASVEYRRPGSGGAAVALVQQWIAHQGDGWTQMLDELGRYYERTQTLPGDQLLPFANAGTLLELSGRPWPPGLDEALGISDDAAATIGARTAEMHRALAVRSGDSNFDPVPVTGADLDALSARWRESAAEALALLETSRAKLPEELRDSAARVLRHRGRLIEQLQLPAAPENDGAGARIRIHGDYHLGRVLRVEHSFVVTGFEGDPARPLAQRRAKGLAFEDVARMMRSFAYAAQAALLTHVARGAGAEERLRPWERLWERAVSAAFLRGYRTAAADADFLPADPVLFERMLDGHVLELAVRELKAELADRPSWALVPLAALLDILRITQGPTHAGVRTVTPRATPAFTDAISGARP